MISIRNVCIIAHVDHGKTTLVDHLFRQSNTFAAHKTAEERVMDSGDLERERGITISAKNAAFTLDDVKVNIVDTPGHADFGGEVERIIGMVDSAILLVDAAEGPLPQTRFVLEKAIRHNLNIMVCINKVDRPEVQGSDLISECENKIFDLFVELEASDAQCEFPIVYACARDGWCTKNESDIPALISGEKKGDMSDLFHLILDAPAPKKAEHDDPCMMVSSLSYSDFVGSMALGRVFSGVFKKGQSIARHGVDRSGEALKENMQITKIFSFKGLKQQETDELAEGDIGLIAGSELFEIGDTLSLPSREPLPRIAVEAPTMKMIFSINTSPFAGKEGKPLQSRELRERLAREARANPALRLSDSDDSDQFYLHGRGELQFGILIETMRREGLEFMVGRPDVLLKYDDNGEKLEPFERLVIDLPETYSGDVTKIYQARKGTLSLFENLPGNSDVPRVRLTFEIPTRGVLGTKSAVLTASRGTALMSSEYLEHRKDAGYIAHRQNGSLVADRSGQTTAYALSTIQQRGELFVGEGVTVYEGMIIGEAAKENDLNVFASRPKKLTNIRTTGSDGITVLSGTRKMSLEDCIEWIDDDEWIEITPQNVRLRKKTLAANMRSVRKKDRMT